MIGIIYPESAHYSLKKCEYSLSDKPIDVDGFKLKEEEDAFDAVIIIDNEFKKVKYNLEGCRKNNKWSLFYPCIISGDPKNEYKYYYTFSINENGQLQCKSNKDVKVTLKYKLDVYF